nr:DNA repair protein complementing XP-C cells [Ciona intestinalis]|eukprot:XP_026691298.1 DNA repair protein complementing XP-C cells [Ciona intestinalis]
MPKSKSTKKRITVKSEKKDVPPSTKKEAASSMSSDEDDWEEVEEDKINQSNIAVKDVEIEFDLPGVVQKQRKKNSAKDWILAFVKRCMNKNIKDRQISLHKVHLVCLLSVGFQLNEVGSSEDLQALILSTLPEKFIDPQPKLMTIERLTNLLNWITSKFTKGNNAVTLKNQGMVNIGEKEKCIEKCIEIESVQQKLDLVLLCLVLFRALGLQVRFVFSVHPISFKPPKYEEVEKNALKLANHLEKLKKVTANQCENLEELLCKVRLVNFTPEEIKEESIPQVDGACDDETTQPRRSTRKRTKVLAEAKTNKNSSSRTKRQKPNEKSSSETEVVSKYEFKDSSLTKEATNTNSNNSKEVSKHFKSKVGNKSRPQRNISPSKKLSIMVSNDKPAFEDNKPCADQQNHISDDQDAVTRKRKNDEEQEKENKVKRTLRKIAVKIKSCPKDSGHLSEENNDFETTVSKKRKTRSNKTKPKTQKAQKQDTVLSDEEDDFLPDQKPDSDDDEDSDFEAVEHKKAKLSTSRPSQLKKPPTKKPVKKASGTKSKSNNQNSEKDINEWLEVYIAKVGWVTVDCVSGVINEPDAIESKTTNPIQYVLSFDGNNSVKDVTSRYASQWLIMTRKLRIGYLEKDWWNNLLACYKTKNKAQDLEENKQLEAKLLSQPLPTSIAAFKSHPLFALRRHLLKYEAVYPPDVPPLGYVKSEEVLPRSSVHCLHTKEKWLQSALTVRDGEQPYKMVASYLLNKKLQRNSDTPSLALFGEWDAVTRKRKNDEEQEKENKVKRTLRKTTVKIKSYPEDSGHLSEENNDFETTVTKKRKTRSNKTKPKTQKVQKQDVVLSDEEEDFLPDQKPDSDDDEDSDFEAVEHKKAKPSTSRPSQLKKPPTKKPVKKASGTKSKSNNQNSEKDINEWLEVYIAKVGWVTVDCVSGVINEPDAIESKTTNPIQYVLSFDGNNSVKDVTSRYASQWLIMTRKLRIGYLEKDWWNNLLACYKTKKQVSYNSVYSYNVQAQDLEENKQLEAKLLSQPLPTSIAAFKSHPLFALRRHLLKYEAVYPPDVPPLGYVKSEEVLPRSSVHCLHTKEKWLQSALTVRDGEQPYKMVASYLLNKKLQRDSDTPSLALFGEWQCDPYQPPVAEGGKVPRNDFGNVDLYQPSMLPIGCVHLRLPNLQVVAKKLNIDIASAVVGFDTHHGFPHPTLDGYVVCKEFEEVLTDAWEEEETLAAERAFAKREERVLKNWKLLFRGVLTLERLRNKYKDVEPIDSTPNEQQTSADEKTPATTSSAWQTERLQNEKEKQKPKRKTRAAKKKTNKNNFPYEVETI